MASSIRVALGVDGAKDFQNAMKQSDAAIKTLGSELKLTTAQFGNAEKSEKGLKAQNDVLERTVLTLNEKLAQQEKALDAVGKEFGEGSVETLKFQQAVNKTKTEIANAQNKIDDNKEAIKNLGKEEKNTSKETKTFGDVLKANLASEAIVAGVKAIGNAVAEVGKKMLSAAKDAAYWADDLNTQAKVTGISTEQLQKYQFAAEQIDVSVDTIAGSMTKLTKNMSAAQKGSKTATAAFEKLGVSFADADGNLRSNDDVFAEAIKALGEIENETERDAMAMDIFGKSAQELNPLIMGGVEALEEYSKMAEDAGLILSQKDLDQLNLISDALDTFKATASAAGKLFMVGFAQPISDAVNKLTGYMQRLTAAFSNNGFEGLAEEAQAIFSELMEEINAILPELFEKGTEILMSIVEGIIGMLPEIINTAMQLILTLATGIADALPELIPALVDTVIAIADGLVDNLPKITEAALKLIIGLAEGLLKAVPELVRKIPQIVASIAKAYIQEIPQMWEVGKQIVAGIWQGIQNAKATFVANVKSFFSNIVSSVKSVLGIASPSKVFASIGKFSAEGFGVGFADEMRSVKQDVNDSMSFSCRAIPARSVSSGGGFAGLGVYMDGVKVGSLVSLNQSNTARAMA